MRLTSIVSIVWNYHHHESNSYMNNISILILDSVCVFHSDVTKP